MNEPSKFKKLEVRGNEISIPLRAREDKNGDEYFVAHPQEVPINISLEDYVVFFFPPAEGKSYGKLLLRPAKAEQEEESNEN